MNEFKRALEAADLTQAWAARQMRTTPGWLGKVLNGQEKPSTELLEKMDRLAAKLKPLSLAQVS